MTATDKAEFVEQTKETMILEYGIPWESIEPKIMKGIEDTGSNRQRNKNDKWLTFKSALVA